MKELPPLKKALIILSRVADMPNMEVLNKYKAAMYINVDETTNLFISPLNEENETMIALWQDPQFPTGELKKENNQWTGDTDNIAMVEFMETCGHKVNLMPRTSGDETDFKGKYTDQKLVIVLK